MGRPRGGKSKAGGSGDGGTPSKKARLEANTISGRHVRWEWEGDKGKWMQYASQLDQEVTDAYNNDRILVDFEVGSGIQMQVRLENMVQKNKKTGWERVLRLAIKDSSDDEYYVWTFQDEKGRHIPYAAKASIDLEDAYHSGEATVEVEAAGRSYKINIKKMEQTNIDTEVKRKVFRQKAESEAADPSAPAPKITTSSTGKSKVKQEPMEEDEEIKGSKGAKSGRKAGKSGAKKSAAENGGGEEKIKVKTVVMKGAAPVDDECPLLGKAQVFCEGKDIWDCMLNQTNVSNNNNKYFIIQLLQEDARKAFHVWFRWGRVGYKGQNNLVPCGPDLEQAKKAFCKKFSEKTKNDWANRKKFAKVAGKYDLLEMDYSTKGTDEPDAVASSVKKEDVKVPDSNLDKKIQDLINLICDVKSMEEAVVEMKYDAKKAPLGKLTADQIKAGYAALKKIDTCIDKGDFGSNLTHACDEFYTRIPHDFGMKTPPVIRTKDEVKKKMQLLEALDDIEIAIKMLKQGDRSENPVDRHYKALTCDLSPVDRSSEEFGLVDKYLQNTHATTHNQYKMKILDLFDVEKKGEAKKFNDCGNRMLLWHGSRLTNWVGILSQGLRIAPPEAPVTGYMFGKGVYFADMSSKSANYCFATRTKKTGLLLLCDVALGQCNELLAADYKADKLPTGKHSVKGCGSVAPDPKASVKTPDGVTVPLGKGSNTKVSNPHGYTLNYNEFIVYNTNQIKMKYLLKVEFNFK